MRRSRLPVPKLSVGRVATMAVYAHDAEADVWDCELSDDDESSLFSALPARLPKKMQGSVPAAANTAVATQAHAATSAVGGSLPNGTEPTEQCGASSTTSQTELLVASGNTKQRRLKLTKGDQISWKFRETSGHRVDFSVFFVRVGMGPGDEIKIKPLSRCDEDTGSYVAKGSGELVLMFDNQFSWWTDKLIDFAVTRLRLADGEGGSPSGAGGHAGLHVGAAGGATDGGNTAQAEAGDANSEPQNTLPDGEVDADQAQQAGAEKRHETPAEKAKRLWEAEAEAARARWRQQEAESTDDDSEEGEEEDEVDDGDDDDDDGDESDQEEDQSTDTEETEPGTDEDEKGERQQRQQEEQSEEPRRDKAWALAAIEKGKGAEAAGHQAAAVELFESAIAALDALGEPRPKLVTRVERLRRQLAEAPSELAEKPTAAEELGDDVRRRVQLTRAFTALREDITAEKPPPQQSAAHRVKSADGDEPEFQYAAQI